MRVLLIYRHNRRCIAHFFRRAFQQLGHDVLTVGPWDESEPMGTEGREPDVRLPWRWPDPEYNWKEVAWAISKSGLATGPSEVRILIDGGEGLRVHHLPDPWLHHALEGSHLDWSDTPHKSAGLMQHVTLPNVTWIPGGFDVEWHTAPEPRVNDYDLVQIANPRQGREAVWDWVQRNAPDLRTRFEEIWGPEYAAIYQRARATYVCSTQNFVTMRVFEAMAMGTVLLADRTPAMAALFNEGEHYIGYNGLASVYCEHVPPVDWLVATVRRLRDHSDDGMAVRAAQFVRAGHSWQHRAMKMLEVLNG